MRKRIVVVPAAVAAAAFVLGTGAAQASTESQAAAPSLPPACVRVPLPNPFIPGAQLQVGLCPQ